MNCKKILLLLNLLVMADVSSFASSAGFDFRTEQEKRQWVEKEYGKVFETERMYLVSAKHPETQKELDILNNDFGTNDPLVFAQKINKISKEYGLYSGNFALGVISGILKENLKPVVVINFSDDPVHIIENKFYFEKTTVTLKNMRGKGFAPEMLSGIITQIIEPNLGKDILVLNSQYETFSEYKLGGILASVAVENIASHKMNQKSGMHRVSPLSLETSSSAGYYIYPSATGELGRSCLNPYYLSPLGNSGKIYSSEGEVTEKTFTPVIKWVNNKEQAEALIELRTRLGLLPTI